ncbi:MAG TPA: lamin tail domain-containing protein, partial [Candidatus Marinimicrobia bacterium]|nr:lamin tail domain-containing protein [Candidatus Neomarinimicrobiota bacterium]
ILDCPKTMPALNNTKDSIVIRDHSAHLIDGLEYSSAWGYRQGVSLERKNPFVSSNQASNWSLSTDLDKATPGRRNSIDLRDYDLALDSVKIKPGSSPPSHNSPVTAQIYLHNNGKKLADAFKINIAITSSVLGTISDTTITISSPLQSGEIQTVAVTFNAIPGGLHQISAEILWSADETLTNNIANCALSVGYPTGVLVINEIMFVPLAGQCEWFEIYNRSEIALDLNGWSFRDAMGKRLALADSGIVIKVGEYAVVAARSDFTLDYPEFQELLIVPTAFPTLNNTTDSLFLYDATDNIIDIICYRDSWGGGTGVSLERLDPAQPALNAANWGGSLVTATPGRRNSIDLRDYDLALDSVKVKPGKSPFQHNSPVTAQIYLRNNGKKSVDAFKINIAIINSFLGTVSDTTITISSALNSGESQMVAVTFRAIPGGLHKIAAEILWSADETLTNNITNCILSVGYPTGLLVINEIMFVPLAGQCEWFEIYNRSAITLDLNGWKFRDAMGKRLALADSGKTIEAGEYAVVAAHSDFTLDYPDYQELLIVPTAFPTLNNTTDSLFLYDATG